MSIATSDGVESMGGKLNSIGLTSTPIIHFLVMCWNTNEEYGRANEAGYYSKLSSAFNHVHNVVNLFMPSSLLSYLVLHILQTIKEQSVERIVHIGISIGFDTKMWHRPLQSGTILLDPIFCHQTKKFTFKKSDL